MNAEEAIRQYQEWRERVIGNKVTVASTMEELCIQLREEPSGAEGVRSSAEAPRS